MRGKILLVFTLLFIWGCGNSENFVVTGTGATPTGNVNLLFTLAQGEAPAGSTSIVVRGRNSGNVIVFGPQSFPIGPTVQVTGVPITVVTLEGEVLNGTTTVGTFSETVEVTEGQTVTVNVAVTEGDGGGNGGGGGDGGAVAQLDGTYFAVAGLLDPDGSDTVERETNLRADLVLDGAGNIAAGMATTVQHDGEFPGAHLGGTYALATDGTFTATIDTGLIGDVMLDQAGEVDVNGSLADFATGIINADSGDTTGVSYLVRRGTGLSNSSLNGVFVAAGFTTSLNSSQTGLFIQLPFDGTGGYAQAPIIFSPGLDSFFSNGNNANGGIFFPPFGNNPTYTVDDDGDFTSTITFSYNDENFMPQTFDITLTGVVGADGDLIFTLRIPNVTSGVGNAFFTEPNRIMTRAVRAQTSGNPIAAGRRCVTVVRTFSDRACLTGQTNTAILTGEVTVDSSGSYTGSVSNAELGNLTVTGSLNTIGTSTSVEGDFNGRTVSAGEGAVNNRTGRIQFNTSRTQTDGVESELVTFSAPKS